MKVILLRHGRTKGNITANYNGCTDDSLNEEGTEQAQRTGIHEEVTHVYVSPLTRARQTAKICFPNAEQTVVDGVHEMNFGRFEGKNSADLADDPEFEEWIAGRCEGPCPDGEGIDDVMARTREAFMSIVKMAEERGEDPLIVVSHGGAISTIMENFAPDSYQLPPRPAHVSADADRYLDPAIIGKWHAPNCGGWCMDIDPDTWESAPFFSNIERFDEIPL